MSMDNAKERRAVNMPTYNCYTAFERVYVKCTEAAARMDPILRPELTDLLL